MRIKKKIGIGIGIGIALAALSLTAHAENLTPNLQINGFATFGGAFVDDDFGGVYLGDAFNKNKAGLLGITDDPSFDLDSVLGLQLSYRLDEKFDLVGQLVSSGAESYNTRAEWAYIAYRQNDNLRFRAGRFAFPLFMYSETLRVGQSYPFVRTPTELYGAVPLTNLDGLDALYRLPMGNWNMDAQLFMGGSSAEYAAAHNTSGLNLTLSNDSLSMRLGYTKSKVDLNFSSIGLPPGLDISNNVDTSFADAGFIYDDGAWFLAGEYGEFRLDGFVADSNSGFVAAGHYFGKWLPFVMYANTNSVNSDECYAQATPIIGPGAAFFCPTQEKDQTAYSAGVRYSISDRISFKGQIDHVSKLNGTSGFLVGTTSTPDKFNVFSFNVNASF